MAMIDSTDDSADERGEEERQPRHLLPASGIPSPLKLPSGITVAVAVTMSCDGSRRASLTPSPSRVSARGKERARDVIGREELKHESGDTRYMYI